jgi:hypothetical protein
MRVIAFLPSRCVLLDLAASRSEEMARHVRRSKPCAIRFDGMAGAPHIRHSERDITTLARLRPSAAHAGGAQQPSPQD